MPINEPIKYSAPSLLYFFDIIDENHEKLRCQITENKDLPEYYKKLSSYVILYT